MNTINSIISLYKETTFFNEFRGNITFNMNLLTEI